MSAAPASLCWMWRSRTTLVREGAGWRPAAARPGGGPPASPAELRGAGAASRLLQSSPATLPDRQPTPSPRPPHCTCTGLLRVISWTLNGLDVVAQNARVRTCDDGIARNTFWLTNRRGAPALALYGCPGGPRLRSLLAAACCCVWGWKAASLAGCRRNPAPLLCSPSPSCCRRQAQGCRGRGAGGASAGLCDVSSSRSGVPASPEGLHRLHGRAADPPPALSLRSLRLPHSHRRPSLHPHPTQPTPHAPQLLLS